MDDAQVVDEDVAHMVLAREVCEDPHALSLDELIHSVVLNQAEQLAHELQVLKHRVVDLRLCLLNRHASNTLQSHQHRLDLIVAAEQNALFDLFELVDISDLDCVLGLWVVVGVDCLLHGEE